MKAWVVIGKYSDGPGDSGRPHVFGVFSESLKFLAETCAIENKQYSAFVAYLNVNESNIGPWDPKNKILPTEFYETKYAPK